MKVLIVDDNRAITDIVQQIVENQNHQTRTAFNGQQGYQAYLDFDPDCIITDVEMPDINGFELMENIRQHTNDIKTVYMSGNISDFNTLLEEEKDKYSVEFIGKPFSRQELITLLGNHV